jgi:predicted phosphatase
MQVIPNDRILAVDVDGTLVDTLNHITISPYLVLNYGNSIYKLAPRRFNIDLMIHHKRVRGYFIMVWSANGVVWAERVVKLLGLEQYVDLVITKPLEYIDDKPVEQWMTNRIWLEEK